jgi:hypothetical protein
LTRFSVAAWLTQLTVYIPLADLLLTALKDGDFSAERFEYLDRLQQRLLDYNDRLVHCSFIAFSDFALWNAWYRVWSFGGLLNVFRIKKMQDRYKETGDLASLSGLNNPSYLGSLCPDLQQYEELFDGAASAVEAVGEGKLSSKEAAEKILSLFDRADFVPPMFEFPSADRRYNCKFDLTILSRFLLGANLLCQSFNSFAGKRVSPAVESLYQLHIKWGVRPIPPLLYKVTAAQEGRHNS